MRSAGEIVCSKATAYDLMLYCMKVNPEMGIDGPGCLWRRARPPGGESGTRQKFHHFHSSPSG
jgi:hypothetical protein